jgi:hypothetical protein
MIKKYNSFIRESVANRGKGPGNNDLFLNTPKKQTINQSNQTVDFLRSGKHIKTNDIDGFVDSIQNERIYISDRLTGEIKAYSIKEVLKGIGKYDVEKMPSTVSGFEGTPAWAKKQKIYESLEDDEFPDIENPEDEINIDDDDYDDDDYDDDYDDDDDMNNDGTINRNGNSDSQADPLVYGTEDNPEGDPDKGIGKEIVEENWVNYWNNYEQNSRLINENASSEEEYEEYEEEEGENEFEVPIIRGTEDNPIPSRRKRRMKVS